MLIVDNIEWLHVYWRRGPAPRGALTRYDVKDPPTCGWQHAVLIRGEKRCTLFCPYSFVAYSVRADCAEIELAREPERFDREWFVDHMRRKWNECQRYGWQRDYDTAALVFKKMGETVPEQIMKGGEEDTRSRGGKEVGSKLLKPVKLSGKRGKFLKWFMDGGCSRSVRETMAEFSMTRSNALSYLYMLQKDHGIGYDLVGDVASISLPDGCSWPFDEPNPKQSQPEIAAEDDDDAWLD